MSTIINYVILPIITFLGVSGFLSRIISLIFYKRVELSISVIVGVFVWVGISYLCLLLTDKQVPQLALAICLLASILSYFVSHKQFQAEEKNMFGTNSKKDSFRHQGITSLAESVSIFIVIILSLFIYKTIHWI